VIWPFHRREPARLVSVAAEPVSVDDVIDRVLTSMSPADLLRVCALRISVRSRPNAEDLARGATATHQGYFYGCAAVLPDRESSVLPDERPASGEIVVFLDNLEPATPERFEVVLRHELAHALGHEEEEIVNVMGLSLCGT
jgi:hypothetical protein